MIQNNLKIKISLLAATSIIAMFTSSIALSANQIENFQSRGLFADVNTWMDDTMGCGHTQLSVYASEAKSKVGPGAPDTTEPGATITIYTVDWCRGFDRFGWGEIQNGNINLHNSLQAATVEGTANIHFVEIHWGDHQHSNVSEPTPTDPKPEPPPGGDPGGMPIEYDLPYEVTLNWMGDGETYRTVQSFMDFYNNFRLMSRWRGSFKEASVTGTVSGPDAVFEINTPMDQGFARIGKNQNHSMSIYRY